MKDLKNLVVKEQLEDVIHTYCWISYSPICFLANWIKRTMARKMGGENYLQRPHRRSIDWSSPPEKKINLFLWVDTHSRVKVVWYQLYFSWDYMKAPYLLPKFNNSYKAGREVIMSSYTHTNTHVHIQT